MDLFKETIKNFAKKVDKELKQIPRSELIQAYLDFEDLKFKTIKTIEYLRKYNDVTKKEIIDILEGHLRSIGIIPEIYNKINDNKIDNNRSFEFNEKTVEISFDDFIKKCKEKQQKNNWIIKRENQK